MLTLTQSGLKDCSIDAQETGLFARMLAYLIAIHTHSHAPRRWLTG